MANDGTAPRDGQIVKGLLDTLVLQVLLDGANYGFGIRARLAETLGEDAEILQESTLYPLLHRLEEKGCITAYLLPGKRGTPRKYYELTLEGRTLLARRTAEWRRVCALLEKTVLANTPPKAQTGRT